MIGVPQIFADIKLAFDQLCGKPFYYRSSSAFGSSLRRWLRNLELMSLTTFPRATEEESTKRRLAFQCRGALYRSRSEGIVSDVPHLLKLSGRIAGSFWLAQNFSSQWALC
mmetsp:Transcript_21070/g.30635  ORF Transcript_21070/g.30635 Transcript_21070/m.30635 type:complete len:111 (-) Transcript_21070:163-495(-)